MVLVAEQLVEIVARAMSPSMNDPITAINCIHWLEAGLAAIVGRDHELHVFTVEGVITKPISFEHLLAHSLGDCISYIKEDPLTRQMMQKVVNRLADLGIPGNK